MLTVKINGVEKQALIDWSSISIEQVATNQIDSAKFRISKHAGKTFTPIAGDIVLILDGATEIFGGTIVRIQDSAEGTMTYFDIECASYERELDRYLVVREIQSQNARYILNAIISEFVNHFAKSIETGEVAETWTVEQGACVANTTPGQYISGSQSRKITTGVGTTAYSRVENVLDLTKFSDGSISTDDDYIRMMIYIEDPSTIDYVQILTGSDTGATYTNYMYAIISGPFIHGFNEVVILKSTFTVVGTATWANSKKRQYLVGAKPGVIAAVSFDDIRLLQASSAFLQSGISDADIDIGSVKFNYEPASSAIRSIAETIGCDWYISPNRILTFFAPGTLSAPFSLTDDSKNFLWNSLRLTDDLTTIRNQIYVRGGEYQGNSFDFEQLADGTALNYRSPYKLKNISVMVGGVSKTVGIDNVDDPASFDCVYNFDEKNLKFKSATNP